MLVTVLPFFLAAHISTENSSIPEEQFRWQPHGPECTYEVLVNMTLSNVIDPSDIGCSMIMSDLKCRPKHSDSLSCRFQNPRITRASTNCGNRNNFIPTSDRFLDQDPFEIRFNSRGIENLVVRRTIPRWRLDTIKAIVSQLNLGFERDEKREHFNTTENSSVGRCEVDVKVSKYGHQMKKGHEKDFELVLEETGSGLNLQYGAVLQIDKTRQPKKCLRKAVYFFGNHNNYTKADKGVYMDMASSTSRIIISKENFSSYTIVEGILKTPDNSGSTRPQQKISVTLKSIEPARTETLTIPNPASTSVYAYSNVDRMRRRAFF